MIHVISMFHSDRSMTGLERTGHRKRLKCIGYPKTLAKITHHHLIYFVTWAKYHRISQLMTCFLKQQSIKPFLSSAA